MLKKRVEQKRRSRSVTHTQGHPKPAAEQSKRSARQPNYEQLGKLLFAIGETGTKSRKKLYMVAFWKGVWGGLGGVIGATIVVSILLFFFNTLGSVPLIGEFIDLIDQSIPSNIDESET